MQIFITGTDTGVGKTVVTGLYLAHLVRKGVKVRAVKPFCSGERTDAVLLWELQERVISLEEVNPYYFPVPIAPWTAARAAGRRISLDETAGVLRRHARECDVLLIEGAGGLLAPLGEGFNAADLIQALGAEVFVVAANRIGVLNHTLLTCEALAAREIDGAKIVLSDVNAGDESARTNEEDLRRLLPGVVMARVPNLSPVRVEAEFFRLAAARLEAELDVLAR